MESLNPSDRENPQEAPAVLIIAYLRPDNLKRILDVAYKAKVSSIFISIDVPKNPTDSQTSMSLRVRQVAEDFRSNTDSEVVIFLRESNVGCSPAVLSSCDWFFSQVNEGIVLEDDCLPDLNLFTYFRDSMTHINDDDDIWLACGTQFAPSSICATWQKSKYALTWGWATNRKKWHQMSAALRKNEGLSYRETGIPILEYVYWRAGARRAYAGFSDSWDTPFVYKMLTLKKFAILPSVSFVTNVGSDSVATHTNVKSKGLHRPLGEYQPTSSPPRVNPNLDDWLKENFYRIRIRHLFTTQITFFIDLFTRKKNSEDTLISRWDRAAIKS